MGKQVQVKEPYSRLWLYPDGVFDAGDVVTISDAEYAALGTAGQSRVTVLGTTADPNRSDPLTEQGVGKMMHAFVPAGHFFMLATETIAGWDAPGFQTVDGVGSYLAAPFTGAPASLPAPPTNTWQQNQVGVAIYLNVMAAIVGTQGTNGHMYLITSPDGVTIIRQDFLALRTGPAGS